MAVPPRYTRDQIRQQTHDDLIKQPLAYFHEYPCMPGGDVLYLERMLRIIHQQRQRPVEVLEWGCGGSTVYFTKYLEAAKIPFTWRSIESHGGWANSIRKNVNPTYVTIKLFDKGDIDLKAEENRTVDMEDYITWPGKQADRYDMIIVDGRRRRRCLLEARHLMKPEGYVLLHDAWREHYHCACETYEVGRFINGTEWWEGRNSG